MEIIIDDKACSLMQAFHIIREEIERQGRPKENSFGVPVNGKFIERLSTDKISPEEYIWTCKVWEVVESDLIGFAGKLINPVDKKFVQTQKTSRGKSFSVVWIDKKAIPLSGNLKKYPFER
jgi:hypothetical protein